MSGEGVIVKIHFGVQGEYIALFGHEEGIYFSQGGVCGFEGSVETHDELDSLFKGVSSESQLEGKIPGLEGEKSGGWIDVFFEDQLRSLGCDFFNLDAAL